MKRSKNIIIFLFCVILLSVGIWIFQIMTDRMPLIDQVTRSTVDKLESSFLFDVFRMITNLGSEFFLYPFVPIAGILLIIWYKHWLPGLLFAGGTLLAHILNIFIKQVVVRDRPSISVSANAEGHSFPSGHSMIPMVCYGLLAYFIARKLKSKAAILTVQILAALLIFLIGISRYVINVHYLTDVIAGFFFGFLLLIALIFLYERITVKRTRS
ncbi:phosphatase PAP2 family protein [Oceanobacillus sp. CAU 1775]